MEGLGINFKSGKIAIIDGDKKVTYKELQNNILKFHQFLLQSYVISRKGKQELIVPSIHQL